MGEGAGCEDEGHAIRSGVYRVLLRRIGTVPDQEADLLHHATHNGGETLPARTA